MHVVITGRWKDKDFSERTEFNDGKSSSTPRTTAFDENTVPFLYTVHYTMSLRSPRWNMTTKCRSCSEISSTVCTAKTQRHHGFLPLTLSCILLALVRYTATCYWHRVSNNVSRQHRSICLSIRHIRPTCYYTIVSQSRLSWHTLSCVLAAFKDVEGSSGA